LDKKAETIVLGECASYIKRDTDQVSAVSHMWKDKPLVMLRGRKSYRLKKQRVSFQLNSFAPVPGKLYFF